MSSIEPVGLRLRPPASKQTPFPTKAIKSSGLVGLPEDIIRKWYDYSVTFVFQYDKAGSLCGTSTDRVEEVEALFGEFFTDDGLDFNVGTDLGEVLAEFKECLLCEL